MQKQNMAERLANDDFNNIIEHGFLEFLDSILMYGFKGYGNMTDEELQAEFNSRDFPNNA